MNQINRRHVLKAGGTLAASMAMAKLFPAWASSGTTGAAAGQVLSGNEIALTIGEGHFTTGGRSSHHAVMVNGTVPGPLIRLREGDTVRLAVTNRLQEQTSIHWHGLLLPFNMDGVPGVSFPGIDPGETFTYEFPLLHSGTYWYHSHSGMQEAVGLFGPLIVDPKGIDPNAADREHVIVLSDWSPLHPHELMRRLKIASGHFNEQKQTIAGLLAGRDQSAKERREWAAMRMDPTDISDVTGATYSFLVNGQNTADNWTGLFVLGEKVRLRIINASAMTNFNFRIPGLAMTIVEADGNAVQPVEVDEFQIAIAETYDVIVTPGACPARTPASQHARHGYGHGRDGHGNRRRNRSQQTCQYRHDGSFHVDARSFGCPRGEARAGSGVAFAHAGRPPCGPPDRAGSGRSPRADLCRLAVARSQPRSASAQSAD